MVYVDRAPSSRLNEAYSFLFDQHALSFLNDFVTSFENDFDKVFYFIYLLFSLFFHQRTLKLDREVFESAPWRAI